MAAVAQAPTLCTSCLFKSYLIVPFTRRFSGMFSTFFYILLCVFSTIDESMTALNANRIYGILTAYIVLILPQHMTVRRK